MNKDFIVDKKSFPFILSLLDSIGEAKEIFEESEWANWEELLVQVMDKVFETGDIHGI
jgi:hypothetical protein